MGYVPIFMDVGNRPCVVVGGGEIAERRVRALLDQGANVTVVSPQMSAQLAALAECGAIGHLARHYRAGDLRGCVLVYAATGERELDEAIAAEARATAIPINVADAPALCTFIAPAVLRRGALQIAVSTGGASPALARRIRDGLEPRFGPEYETLVEILQAVRRRLQKLEPDASARAMTLDELAGSELREYLARGDFAAIDRLLARSLGDGINLKRLGFDSLAAHQHAVNGSR